MLVDHPVSGLGLLVAALPASGVTAICAVRAVLVSALARPMPDPAGIALWQARQSALLELSIARKFGLFLSMFCT